MTALKYVFLFSADVALIGLVVHFVYMCLHKPVDFIRWQKHRSDQFGRLGSSRLLEKVFGSDFDWKAGVYCGFIFLGTGLLVFGAIQFMFSWMPHTWLRFDEEGEPKWEADLLAGLIASFAAVGLPIALEKAAHRAYDLETKNADMIERLTTPR